MNYIYTIIAVCLLIGLFVFYKQGWRAGFQNHHTNKWSADLIKRFNLFQLTVNENDNQFNMEVLQQQASPEEAEILLKTGYWPWPDNLKQLFIDKIWADTVIKIDPQVALNNAMKIYNQAAARELLAWNTKEGHFLLYGGVSPKGATIQCSKNGTMEKKVYTGMNLWNGYTEFHTTDVKPDDIPKEMPGFQFVNKPCNPCVALNIPGDFKCPFRLNVKGNNSISEPWRELWGL